MKRVADWFGGETICETIAVAACLTMPVGLLYGRTIADALTVIIGVTFLIHSAIERDWTWVRSPWIVPAALFWSWMLICSVVMGQKHDIVQSIVSLRLFLFTAALDVWVLRREDTRRWLWWVVLAVVLWVAAQSWQQYLTGTNFLGYPRYEDGALTGPFFRPRAGGTYLMLFFPAFLPALLPLLTSPDRRRALLGLVLLGAAVTTMVIIGQRMPTLLLTFGLLLTALLIRRLRVPVLIVLLIGAVMIALTPVLSPPTYAKLVVRFTEQMGHFWQSPYGLLFTRAMVMLSSHPVLGFGFDGFRNFCTDPGYDHALAWAHLAATSGSDPVACSIHPHNYYLLVATNAGIPGLVLFAALVVIWLRRILPGPRPWLEPRRTALFVIVATSLWPIASTTTMFTFPNAGWLFLMIGWGLAEARPSS